MTDSVIIALAGGVFSVINTTLVLVIKNKVNVNTEKTDIISLKVDKAIESTQNNSDKILEVHQLVNSGLTKLVEATAGQNKAEGILEGVAQEKSHQLQQKLKAENIEVTGDKVNVNVKDK